MTERDRRTWLWGLAVIWAIALPLSIAFSDPPPGAPEDRDWAIFALGLAVSFLWTKGLDRFDPKLKRRPPASGPRSRHD